MSCDTPRYKILSQAPNMRVDELLKKASRDPDAVSAFVDGTSWNDAEAAIFVVKGGDRARAVNEWFRRQGLTTDNPVSRS